MPLTTFDPRNGGTNTSLSVSTSGERAGMVDGSTTTFSRLGMSRPPGARPQSGSSSPLRLSSFEAVHHVEALEGVLAVEQPALVDLAQVALDVGAGQRGAAQHHRDAVEAAGVQLLEVLPHDQGRLHQQARHADGVGLDLERLLDHLGDRDLDAEVVHLVAVVGEDDVDQVLADVVDVALHRGQHQAALRTGVALDLLHVGFEVGDGGLHGLGRLQHERAAASRPAEQLADHLHARPAARR